MVYMCVRAGKERLTEAIRLISGDAAWRSKEMQLGPARGHVSVLCVVVVVRPMQTVDPGGRVEGCIDRAYAESGSRRYRC